MFKALRPTLFLVGLTVLPSCAGLGGDSTASRPPALYDDLGSHHCAITTSSKDAQRYFDQGLVLAYAFNHDEAIRCFGEAARLDPRCAMAYWGIALANGPHINNPGMDEARSRAAWDALTKARELSASCNESEQMLIKALSHRYTPVPPADRGPLDQAYAQAMRSVWQRLPENGDVGMLFAEALMDLHPWDLWTKEGNPKTDTEEIVATLEAVLAKHPKHPGANHLYIHAVEASLHPERAAAAADRLRTLVPGAGHLVHMPAHIDLRLGRYAAACEANVRAMAADKKHEERFPRAGFYRIYMAHNPHFLSFASMMEGRQRSALDAAKAVIDGVPEEFIKNSAASIDGYLPIKFHVLVRFGRWEDILKEPAFPEPLLFSNATRHYARGTALAALGRPDEADQELKTVEEIIGRLDERVVGINSAKIVLSIAVGMLQGEIALARGKHDVAIQHLKEAMLIEDGLQYMEPPDWMHPVRHALGAVLVEAGRYDEAENVFLQDLKRFPENGWSLMGLAQSLKGRGVADEAAKVGARFDKAWSRADVKIQSSCYCVPGSKPRS